MTTERDEMAEAIMNRTGNTALATADALIAAGFGSVTAIRSEIEDASSEVAEVTTRAEAAEYALLQARAGEDALAAKVAAVEALVAPQWRSVPHAVYDIEGTFDAYLAGRNLMIDAVRAVLASDPSDLVAEGFASRDYWKHMCWSYMAESAARANLLTRVVNAVRGNPPYPLAWSHQDAPERVAGVVAERGALAAKVAAVTTLVAAWTEDLTDNAPTWPDETLHEAMADMLQSCITDLTTALEGPT